MISQLPPMTSPSTLASPHMTIKPLQDDANDTYRLPTVEHPIHPDLVYGIVPQEMVITGVSNNHVSGVHEEMVTLPYASNQLPNKTPWIKIKPIRNAFTMHVSASELRDPEADIHKLLMWPEKKASQFFQRAYKTQKNTYTKKRDYIWHLAFYYNHYKGLQLSTQDTIHAQRLQKSLSKIVETFKENVIDNLTRNGTNNNLDQPSNALAVVESPPSYEECQQSIPAFSPDGLPSYHILDTIPPLGEMDPAANNGEVNEEDFYTVL